MSTPAKSIRIVIADDHTLSRRSLKLALKQTTSFDMIGDVENGNSAVDLCLSQHPDVVLMDIGMPVKDGIEATKIIKSAAENIKIIMLTSLQNIDNVKKALMAGADGYCLKKMKTRNLIKVIEIISEGGVYLDPDIARLVILEQSASNNASKNISLNKVQNTEHVLQKMSEHELNMFRFLVMGRSSKEIAETFHMNEDDANEKIAQLLSKLSIENKDINKINVQDLVI